MASKRSRLLLDVLLKDFQGSTAAGGGKVAGAPKDVLVVALAGSWKSPQQTTGHALEAVDYNYETGHISTEQFVLRTMQEIGYTGTARDFQRAWNSLLGEHQAMITVFNSVRKAGFKTYVLSNSNPMHVEYMQRNFPFLAKFDGFIFSHEVGQRKPSQLIYEAMEQMSGKRGKDILYIDDLVPNIDAAMLRGWECILQANHGETIRTIKSRLKLES